MVCLGLQLEVAGWKAQTNPLSYGGTPMLRSLLTLILPITVIEFFKA